MKSRQTGLSLIEVMISLTMGVFFLVVAMQYLISGQQSFRSQDTGSRIQENARFAIELIREQVRMAGYSEINSIVPPFIYVDSCGADALNGQTPTQCSDDTITDQGDRLAVSLLSPIQEDCLGNALTDASTQIANVFWVEVNNNVSSLYCRGFDIDDGEWISAAQPLVAGVDQMQVQYGLFNGTTGSVNQYLNATAVQAANAWANVQMVRVSLLVSSGINTDLAANDGRTLSFTAFNDQYSSFSLLDGAAYTPGDSRIRRVYTNTITINNAL